MDNLPNVGRYEVRYNWRVPFVDPDDEKFVDAYVAAQADYLISNDRHFDGLNTLDFPSVRVVSAGAFLRLLV